MSYEARKRQRQSLSRTGSARKPSGDGPPVSRGRSVYEDHYGGEAAGPITVVLTQFGKFLGVERGGVFEPAKPCCADARECQRPECWTPLGDLRT